MNNIISVIAVCLTIMFLAASCSYVAVENTRSFNEIKLACFTSGGSWDSWKSACDHR